MNIFKLIFGILFFIVAGGIYTACLAQVNYKSVDSLALHTPLSAEKSITALADYFDQDSLTDPEKIRLVYRWIADRIEYDFDAFKADWPSAVDPGAVFTAKTAQCEGFSTLFCRLSNELNIPCKSIKGYVKYFNSFEIDTTNDQNHHAWNTVYIQSRWWMSDPTFSIGTYDAHDNSFTKEFNDGYFLVEPDRFIFDHYPFKAEQQLLDEPKSFEWFADYPSVNRHFFELGLEFLDLPEGEIKASKEYRLSLNVPDSVVIAGLLEPAEFGLNGSYTQTDPAFKRIYRNGSNLKIYYSEDQIVIDMKFHEKRLYSLYLFGRYKDQSAQDYKPLTIVSIRNREAATIE